MNSKPGVCELTHRFSHGKIAQYDTVLSASCDAGNHKPLRTIIEVWRGLGVCEKGSAGIAGRGAFVHTSPDPKSDLFLVAQIRSGDSGSYRQDDC